MLNIATNLPNEKKNNNYVYVNAVYENIDTELNDNVEMIKLSLCLEFYN